MRCLVCVWQAGGPGHHGERADPLGGAPGREVRGRGGGAPRGVHGAPRPHPGPSQDL